MAYKEKDILKIYWSIGEVAEELGVATSHVRLYEIELEMNVGRSIHSSNRMFRQKDIEFLKMVMRLSKYFHLEGIKKLKEKGMLNQLDALLQ